MTPHEVLGLPADASAADIRRAHRRLVLRHHPDRNVGNDAAARRLQEVNAAYAALTGRKTEPDNPHVKAYEILANMLYEIVNQMVEKELLVRETDVGKILRDNLQGHIKHLFEEKVHLEAVQAATLEARSRWRSEDQGTHESMVALMDSNLVIVTKKLDKLALKLADLEKAQDIARSLRYDFEEPKPVASSCEFWTPTSGDTWSGWRPYG